MNRRLIVKLGAACVGMMMLIFLLITPIGILPGLGRILSPIGGVWNGPNQAEYPEMQTISGTGYSGKVYRDELGIPHIFAPNYKDWAFIMGYLQARDRMFAMDMQRRAIEGRVAEVMGPGDYLEMDKFYRLMGFSRSAEELWNKMVEDAPSDPEIRMAIEGLQAYCAGVNKYIDESMPNDLPFEYILLGMQPEYWTVLDILTFVKFESFSLGFTEFDIEMTLLRDAMGDAVVDELIPYEPFPFEKMVVPNFIDNTSGGSPKMKGPEIPESGGFDQSSLVNVPELRDGLAGIANLFRKFDVFGLRDQLYQACSNNWVINGSLSYSGKPMLCNDPHLQLLLPAVLWEFHYVNTSVGSDDALYGVSFPGTLGTIMGQTAYAAWGMTNAFCDQGDFYFEKLSPDGTKYYFNNTERPIETVTEVIKVKGQPDYHYTIKLTRHNLTAQDDFQCPLINSTEFGYPGNINLSVKWAGYAPDYGVVKGFARLSQAKNVSDFLEAMEVYTDPGINYVFADVYGNIAIYPKGKYPVRNVTGVVKEGRYILNGSNGEDEWTGYIPFDWIPHKINPPNQMYLASANQRTVNTTEYTRYYTSYVYSSSYRSRRINQILENESYYHYTFGTNITMDRMKQIQTDYYDIAAEIFVPFLLEAFNNTHPTGVPASGETELLNKSVEALKTWNASTARWIMDKDLIAPTIFDTWFDKYKNFTFTDEFEDANLTLGGRLYYQLTDFLENITRYNQSSRWFDNVSTTGTTENASDIMLLALNETVLVLSQDYADFSDWIWGNFHVMDIRFLEGLLPAFDFPQYACSGSSRTINVAPGRNVRGGPVLRMIVDLEMLATQNLYSGYATIPGGQSGNPLSSHYEDNYQYWKNNEYHQILFPRNISAYPVNEIYSTVIFN